MSVNTKTLYNRWLGSLSESEYMPNWENAECNFLRLFESFYQYGVSSSEAEGHIETAVLEHATTLPAAKSLFQKMPALKIKYSSTTEYLDTQRKGLFQICNSVFFSIYPINEEVLNDIAEARSIDAKRKKTAAYHAYVDQFPTVDLDNLPAELNQNPIKFDELMAELEKEKI